MTQSWSDLFIRLSVDVVGIRPEHLIFSSICSQLSWRVVIISENASMRVSCLAERRRLYALSLVYANRVTEKAFAEARTDILASVIQILVVIVILWRCPVSQDTIGDVYNIL
uniref:Uncharacterized protein n=1 Tax=Fusarium oxysporum (strain Fo5176) TaxID=660025 RepID=A0A0D2XSM7_FUSOF